MRTARMDPSCMCRAWTMNKEFRALARALRRLGYEFAKAFGIYRLLNWMSGVGR